MQFVIKCFFRSLGRAKGGEFSENWELLYLNFFQHSDFLYFQIRKLYDGNLVKILIRFIAILEFLSPIFRIFPTPESEILVMEISLISFMITAVPLGF